MNNLYNKIYEAVNTGIQKALIISNGQENDVSVKWHEKGKVSDLNLINYLADEFKENSDAEHYMNILSYYKNNINNRYKVKDIHDLINIYYKIWMCHNRYDRTTGIASKLPIDLKWIDTRNALTFIKYDGTELALHEYDEGDKYVQFIKFKNIKDCEHPIIIHKDLLIDKWLTWNDKDVNVKKFSTKDCVFGYDNVKKDFNGYEHTYNNANIGDYSVCKMPHVYFIDNYQNYPALKSAISIDYSKEFDGYRSYLPAIGELLFLGDCYENMFLDYILKYIGSSANIEMHKDLWWSSTEKSYDQVAVINANPRIPASAFKAENKKNSEIFQMGHIIPMFKEI